MSDILCLNGVSAAYGEADVLADVSVAVRAGEITCILGSNGAGKTTMIRIILGLMRPKTGQILWKGREISTFPTHRRVALGIACIPEGRKVFQKMTVEENLRMGAYLERDRRAIRERLDRVYDVFPKLRDRLAQIAGTMSGGEQAMVSIGRALMSDPELLLVDEPSLGLSPRYVRENFEVIRRANERGITVLLIEQNVYQTLSIAHRGYVLAQGKIVAEGTAEALRENEDVQHAYFGRSEPTPQGEPKEKLAATLPR